MFEPQVFYEADGGAGAGEGAGGVGEGTGDLTGGAGGTGGNTGEGGTPAAQNLNDVLTGKTPAAPESYTFNLGEGLEISDEMKTQLGAIGKENNISQDAMDALLKMHSDVMLDAMHQAESERNAWAEECYKQGLGTKENLALAKLAVDTFGGGEAMQVLVNTGAANHPAVQRMLQAIGGLLKEDNGPDGGNAGAKPTTEQLLFPNSKY